MSQYTLHELEVAAATTIQRVGAFTTQIERDIKAIKALESMLKRQTKALADLRSDATVVVPLDEYKRYKVAIALNKANLEAAQTRLREVNGQLTAAKDQLQSISKAKAQAAPKIIPFPNGR